jgi:hypothetical protein
MSSTALATWHSSSSTEQQQGIEKLAGEWGVCRRQCSTAVPYIQLLGGSIHDVLNRLGHLQGTNSVTAAQNSKTTITTTSLDQGLA